jgi:hypothetical protein
MVDNVRFALYSGYSSKCENIVGCCGLLNAKNAIFNTQYSEQEYSTLRSKLIDHMKSTGEWGQFFPGSFAPNPYDESWVSFYFPLSSEEQKNYGFYFLPQSEQHQLDHRSSSDISRASHETNPEITKETYWDKKAQKPFQVLSQDINSCRELGVAIPHMHYMSRIQENFRWMPYEGILRGTQCAKS